MQKRFCFLTIFGLIIKNNFNSHLNLNVNFLIYEFTESFCGQKRRTSTERSYEPKWNEMLMFTELFPALCRRVQIQGEY